MTRCCRQDGRKQKIIAIIGGGGRRVKMLFDFLTDLVWPISKMLYDHKL